MLEPKAAYATARVEGSPTYGGQVAAVAGAMGTPLMPWQRAVLDTALELHPTTPGAFRYRLVVITVPRQSGKTTLLRALAAWKALTCPRVRIFYTAQTRKDAVDRWEELCDRAQAALGRDGAGRFRVQVKKGVGNETCIFPGGGAVEPFAPNPKNLHGATSPLVMVDEAFAFTAAEGQLMMEAIEPTGITLPDSQIWIVSTAGTHASGWLKELVAKGREAVADGAAPMAYFEWSADPAAAEADPYSGETLAFHPALGHTQSLDSFAALAKTSSPATWRRAYLNLWPESGSGLIDMAAWAELARGEPAEGIPWQRAALAFDIAAERQGATLYAAWAEGDSVRLALVASGPGQQWVPALLASLNERFAPALICADDGGENRPLLAALPPELRVERVGVREYATACQSLIARVEESRVTHCGAEELATAWEAAATRQMGGAAGFSAPHSAGPIDALRSAAVAAFKCVSLSAPIQIF